MKSLGCTLQFLLSLTLVCCSSYEGLGELKGKKTHSEIAVPEIAAIDTETAGDEPKKYDHCVSDQEARKKVQLDEQDLVKGGNIVIVAIHAPELNVSDRNHREANLDAHKKVLKGIKEEFLTTPCGEKSMLAALDEDFDVLSIMIFSAANFDQVLLLAKHPLVAAISLSGEGWIDPIAPVSRGPSELAELRRLLETAVLDLSCDRHDECSFIELSAGCHVDHYVPFSKKTTKESELKQIVVDFGAFAPPDSCTEEYRIPPANPVCVNTRCSFPEYVDHSKIENTTYCSEHKIEPVLGPNESVVMIRLSLVFTPSTEYGGRYVHNFSDFSESGEYAIERDAIVKRRRSTADVNSGYFVGDVLLWDGVPYTKAACARRDESF